MNKKAKKWLVAGVVLIFAFVLLPVCGFQYLRWDLARCYEMPPWEFKDQAQLIQVGMTEKEAIGLVHGYSEMRREDGKILFMLNPVRRSLLTGALRYMVAFRVDQSGRVTSVETYDG